MQEINLNPINYYTLKGEMIFFVSEKNLSSSNKSLFSNFKDDLCKSEYLTICKISDSQDRGRKYTFLSPNFMFEAFLSNKPNFSLAINNIFSDKEKLSYKKYQYYQKSVFLIKTQKNVSVVSFADKQKYTKNGLGDNEWSMDARLTSNLVQLIDEFFDEKKNIIEIGNIDSKFEKNIIKPIRDYSYYEYEAEKAASFGNDNFYYNRFNIVTSTAKKKVYEFFSSSFDPESELFSLGSRVSVDTIEDINDELKKQILGTIVDKNIVDEGVSLKVEFLVQFDNNLLNENEGRIYPLPNETQNKVRTKVINNIYNKTVASKYMYDFFKNYETLGYEKQDGWEEFYQELMSKKYPPNNSQMEAIKKGIETKDIQLVLGPPGTGKTTVIVSWIEYFIRHGKRVLISSQNNSAVDNVLERVGKKPEARIIRIGNLDKIQENCKQYSVENQIDKVSSECLKKVENNLKYFIDDKASIESVLVRISSSKETYKSLEEKYKSLDQFKPKINSATSKLKYFYTKYENLLKKSDDYKKNVLSKEEYLFYLFKRNIFIILFFIPKILLSKISIKYNKFLIRLLLKRIEKVINKYNAQSAKIQSLLFDPKYLEVKSQINELVDKCKDNDFTVKAKSSFPIPTLSMDAQKGYLESSHLDLMSYFHSLLNALERISKTEKALTDWHNSIRSKNSDVISDLVIQNSNVVGATCVGINTRKQFVNLDFDVTIIDESGQIQIHNAIIPMTRSPKTLMLGDHLQIPPMANEDVVGLCKADGVKTDLLEMSFFEYLFKKIEDKGSKKKRRSEGHNPLENLTRLNEQFRMPGNISDVISKWFYEGNYHARYDMNSWSPIVEGTASPLVLVSTSKSKCRFEQGPNDSKDRSPGYCNPIEADLIASIVAKLFKRVPDFNSEKIGVISAYGKQVRLIRSEIRKKLKKEKIKINDAQIYSIAASLDSFQGQERPLIIYSSTRSTERKPPQKARVGFMKELRRLNVAFTRCQKQLIIIGDFDYLTTCQYEELDPETQQPLPNKSEKKYAEFMSLMVEQGKSDKGQFFNLDEFSKQVGL